MSVGLGPSLPAGKEYQVLGDIKHEVIDDKIVVYQCVKLPDGKVVKVSVIFKNNAKNLKKIEKVKKNLTKQIDKCVRVAIAYRIGEKVERIQLKDGKMQRFSNSKTDYKEIQYSSFDELLTKRSDHIAQKALDPTKAEKWNKKLETLNIATKMKRGEPVAEREDRDEEPSAIAALEKKKIITSAKNDLKYKPAIAQKNKTHLLEKTIKLFKEKALTEDYEVKKLQKTEDFNWGSKKKPKFLAEQFVISNDRTVDNTKKYYRYTEGNADTAKHYHLNFANRHVGGGVFGNGFIMEERLMFEFPEIPGEVARNGTLECRKGKSAAGKGVPTPVLFAGVTRVMAVDENVYGRSIGYKDHTGREDFGKEIEPQKANIICAAAPKVYNSIHGISKRTVNDYFNTTMAYMQLAKENTPDDQRTHVHTGKFGCGDFKNDARVAYVLHSIASDYHDIDLTFHAYSDAEREQGEEDYNAVIQEFNSRVFSGKPDSYETLLDCVSHVMKKRLYP